MAENRSQQIRSEQMVDQLSSEIICAITISSPPEDNTTISRYSQIEFLMKEDEAHNMEEKEQLIMKDGELATMMKHQEEDET